MQRVVIDTNLWVSGLVWRTGAPRAVVMAALDGRLQCFTSAALAQEFERVLSYSRIAHVLRSRGIDPAHVVQQFRLVTDEVVAAHLPAPVCRDPDDDEVLACAVAAQAKLVISGDADLLTLSSYQGIRIVTAPQVLALLDA